MGVKPIFFKNTYMQKQKKRIKCNKEFKHSKFTLGKEYEVLDESSWGYMCLNDDGKLASCAKGYFTVIVADEDKLFVRCVDPEDATGKLIMGDEYEIVNVQNHYYDVKDKNGDLIYFRSETRFARPYKKSDIPKMEDSEELKNFRERLLKKDEAIIITT